MSEITFVTQKKIKCEHLFRWAVLIILDDIHYPFFFLYHRKKVSLSIYHYKIIANHDEKFPLNRTTHKPSVSFSALQTIIHFNTNHYVSLLLVTKSYIALYRLLFTNRAKDKLLTTFSEPCLFCENLNVWTRLNSG